VWKEPRIRFWCASWTAYVAFYLCRKNLSVILPIFQREHLYTAYQSAHLVLAFSTAYCLGQFVMGALADRFGGRRVVVAGMATSASVTAIMGFSTHYDMLFACQLVNGAAQATGWSGLMKMMKQYPMRKSGVLMGWWSTNYVVGGFVATLLATYALASPLLAGQGWRRAAWVPAAALLLYGLVFLLATKGIPGLPGPEPGKERSSGLEGFRSVFSSGRIRALMGAYFFVKMIRYSLLFWLPLYLVSQLKMTPVHAGYVSGWLEGYGVVGVLTAAYASDYLFQARRFPVAGLMMLSLCAICIAASFLTAAAAGWQSTLIVALLGAAIYGTDTLLVGAATMDSAKREHMGTIAGAVDGAGSAGQVLSPLFVVLISQSWGWPAVFRYLSLMALLSVLFLMLGAKTERTSAAA
jgi:MFS transporter, OPA family, sugar phosphate sensor protein UhpC